jgi:hypothetical protein
LAAFLFFTFTFLLFTSAVPTTIYQTGDKACAEAVVNVDDCHIRRARIEHSEQRGDAAERRGLFNCK